MKGIFTFITVFLIIACFLILIRLIGGCSSKKTIESRVKSFMADTVSKNINDPDSYEFISMKIDTMTGRDDYEQLKRLSDNSVLFDSAKRLAMKRQMMVIENNPKYMDSVFNYFITVKFKGKNKFGIQVIDMVRLKYFPQTNKMQILGN